MNFNILNMVLTGNGSSKENPYVPPATEDSTLLFHLDAIDNAGLGKHVTGITDNWVDLVSNNKLPGSNLCFSDNGFVEGALVFNSSVITNKVRDYTNLYFEWVVDIGTKTFGKPNANGYFYGGLDNSTGFKLINEDRWTCFSVYTWYKTGNAALQRFYDYENPKQATIGLFFKNSYANTLRMIDTNVYTGPNGFSTKTISSATFNPVFKIYPYRLATSDTQYIRIHRFSVYQNLPSDAELIRHRQLDVQRYFS